jgi:hypothetical protein
VTAYKFLARGAVGRFSEFAWPQPGEWVETGHPIDDCRRGIHAVHPDQLLDWIDDELWEVELDGAVHTRDAMVIAERGRLVRRVPDWDEEAARAFALGCVESTAAVAAKALHDAGLEDAAQRLDAAEGLGAIQGAAVAALEHATEPALVTLVAFTADIAALVSGNRPDAWQHAGGSGQAVQTAGAVAANAGFVAAHIAGRAAVRSAGDENAYGDGFTAERGRQLTEFRRLVGLA